MKAFERMQEILHYDSSFRIWFDRSIGFEVGGDLSADIVLLPRYQKHMANKPEDPKHQDMLCWIRKIAEATDDSYGSRRIKKAT